MKAFLYLTPNQLDVLRYARLHFLAVKQDLCPFINNKSVLKANQPRASEADYQAELKRQFAALPAEINALITWEKFVEGAAVKREQIEAQLKNRLAGKAITLTNPEIYANLASLSLASRADNPLLWERWAANHQGLVLEFNTSHPSFTNKKQLIKKVTYTDARPQASSSKQPFAALFTKPKEFAAEEEIKILRPLEEAKSSQALTTGKEVYFYDFSPKALISVTLGANCSKETKEQLNKILTYDVKYKPGKPLRQAWLEPHSFKLRIKGTL